MSESIDQFIEKWKNKIPKISEAYMRLKTSHVNTIFVEGDTDYHFYYSLLKKRKQTVLGVKGRQNVCDIVNKLQEQYSDFVYGICDKDLLEFNVGKHQGKNIYHTQFHDLEMDCLYFADLSTFLSLYTNKEKIKHINDVIDFTFNLCLPVGYLRLISERDKYHIDFDNFSFKQKNKNYITLLIFSQI